MTHTGTQESQMIDMLNLAKGQEVLQTVGKTDIHLST